MTIASAIANKQSQIAACYTAISNKGGTLPATQDVANMPTAINSIPTGGGGSGKYQLFQRISDDSNNVIGTISGFFKDSNNTEYAVVCLDGVYRAKNQTIISNTSTLITVLPNLQNVGRFAVWKLYTTGTYNTQKILDFATMNGYTAQAPTHCRSLSFTIDGTIYYGQLPNLYENVDIARSFEILNSLDTTGENKLGADLGIPNISSSTQYSASDMCVINNNGFTNTLSKTYAYGGTVPVLELPNAI